MAQSIAANGSPAASRHARDNFTRLLHHTMLDNAESGNAVRDDIAAHFGDDPLGLPIVHDPYKAHVAIVHHVGLQAFLARPGREVRRQGVLGTSGQVALSDLLMPPSMKLPAPVFGTEGEERLACGFKEYMSCPTRTLFFVRDEEGPALIWTNAGSFAISAGFDVMAPTYERALAIVAEINQLGAEQSPFKGKCISVQKRGMRIIVRFVARPSGVTADDVILPSGLLDKLESHAFGIARHSDRLLESGLHLKRGILLYGRPGTGKTHTIRYLASQLADHTILTMPGQVLDDLDQVRHLVPLCAPGVIVLDDVDYIATDRTKLSHSARHNLFELLNTLDGLSPDENLLFVLATNHFEMIESAVAARPGRVDRAVEIPAPDADCRRRLFSLYAKHINLDMPAGAIDEVVARTAGVTGSFFKELLRRATLQSVSLGRPEVDGKRLVTGDDVRQALDEILDPDNPLTMKLLGFGVEEDAPAGTDDSEELDLEEDEIR